MTVLLCLISFFVALPITTAWVTWWAWIVHGALVDGERAKGERAKAEAAKAKPWSPTLHGDKAQP